MNGYSQTDGPADIFYNHLAKDKSEQEANAK